jgi:hypothetical protein
MRIEYDPAHDLLNIEFVADEEIAESVELDGVVIEDSRHRNPRCRKAHHEKPPRPHRPFHHERKGCLRRLSNNFQTQIRRESFFLKSILEMTQQKV